ncbi:hypothetical protein PH5382_03913 [Phaeobacter sp. CECT 5382]|nr:hypothetical protein [Phaeobacter sp. CECT 5382]CUH89958.1 hypothetical protein PH5382_03913 [Phaeobacter sp. CECT 5382]
MTALGKLTLKFSIAAVMASHSMSTTALGWELTSTALISAN